MNKTAAEAVEFLQAFKPQVLSSTHCDIVIAPPFTAIKIVADRVEGTNIEVSSQDVAAEEGLWPRLRRFLRCGRLQIEEGAGGGGGPAAAHGPGAPAALLPEPVDVEVKIVLIGSVEEYYALQEADPDAARRFRVKVDFVERFAATPATRQATAIFVAQTCDKRGLPHFNPDAVALLRAWIEQMPGSSE